MSRSIAICFGVLYLILSARVEVFSQLRQDSSLVFVHLIYPVLVNLTTDTTLKTPEIAAERSRKKTEMQKQVSRPPDFTNTFIYDFFFTVNAIAFENRQTSDQHDELNFYYNTTINDIFRTKYFTYRAYMFNEYGLKYYIDSLTTKGQDRHEVRNSVQIPLKKFLKVSAGFTVKTQLWKQYLYNIDTGTGDINRSLYTAYFSPGYILYTGGISFNFLKNASVDIGIAGGTTTKIKNQHIFEDRKAERLYGLERGERKRFVYSFNVLLNVPPQMLTKHIGWECHALVSSEKEQIGRLKGYKVDATNVLHYMFLKNLRISLRTTMQYDEKVNDKIFMMNMLSIGFYLFNKL